MKYLTIMALAFVAGCSGSNSPTAPTPPVIVTPPVVVVPPPVITPPAVILPVFPPADSRFDLVFYRQFAHNGVDVLRRQPVAPRIYLRTVDDAGIAIEARSVDRAADALINTAGSLTGVFGVAGLERGTDTRQGQVGWITVRWAAFNDPLACGRAAVGGDLITLYPRTPGCRCDGLEVSVRTVKHELGHALGFYHTGVREDLMSGIADGKCDADPSPREVYHAAIAYGRPIGSAAP